MKNLSKLSKSKFFVSFYLALSSSWWCSCFAHDRSNSDMSAQMCVSPTCIGSEHEVKKKKLHHIGNYRTYIHVQRLWVHLRLFLHVWSGWQGSECPNGFPWLKMLLCRGGKEGSGSPFTICGASKLFAQLTCYHFNIIPQWTKCVINNSS